MSRHLIPPDRILQDAQEERTAGTRKGARILGPAEEFNIKYGDQAIAASLRAYT